MSQDPRVRFLSRETREVIAFLVRLVHNLFEGETGTLNTVIPCFGCLRYFKEIKSRDQHVFVVIKDWFKVGEDDLRLCCLSCCRKEGDVMDVVEIYPSLTLFSVRKLMYSDVLRKFVFKFRDSSVRRWRKYAVVGSVAQTVEQAFADKADNDEIEIMRLGTAERAVAEDSAHDLRLDYGRHYNFDRPLGLNPRLVSEVDRHSPLACYYLEVCYRVYDEYAPFEVYFNRTYPYECCFCEGKITAKGEPVLFCSRCGSTDPSYWRKRVRMMMVPFWDGRYDYNKIYWSTEKRKGITANLMLYAADTRRHIP